MANRDVSQMNQANRSGNKGDKGPKKSESPDQSKRSREGGRDTSGKTRSPGRGKPSDQHR